MHLDVTVNLEAPASVSLRGRMPRKFARRRKPTYIATTAMMPKSIFHFQWM